MAQVTNTYWLLDGLGGSVGFENITQNETCIVVFDEAVNNVSDAVADSGFRLGQRHRYNPLLSIAGTIDPVAITSTEWQFDLTYSTMGTIQSPTDEDFTPIIEPGKWATTKVIYHDKETGDPIENPAGDPYNPPPVAEVYYPRYRITLREFNANMGRLQLLGSVNNATINIVGIPTPKYCAMFTDYTPKQYVDDDDNIYFLNEFEISFNFNVSKTNELIGFKLEYLAQGFNELIVAGDKTQGIKPIMENNEPVSNPRKLGANGQQTDTPFYQNFSHLDLINFSTLGLPAQYPTF